MKMHNLLKGLLLIPLFSVGSLFSQQIVSFDFGAIRQKANHTGGLNMSGFYHFNKQLLGGVEVNRFFPARRVLHNENVMVSGWDFEMNFHYQLFLSKSFRFYPISGISHTSEREADTETKINHYESFWSVNTGAGLLVEIGKWLPHLEYNFSWGHLNQQFVLLGVGYEIEWGRHKNHHAEINEK